MSKCYLCPKNCGADRKYKKGFCRAGDKIKVARAGVHYWEEPPISGIRGSGTVFFSGCNLKCVYCQNFKVSHEFYGAEITVERLKEIYKELERLGVHNINLVTPTHFSDKILESLDVNISIPFVYNCGGYEKTETIRKFSGKISIFMPDLKYLNPGLSLKYSRARDYPEVAKNAVKEMYKITGKFKLDSNGVMEKGVIIRHLMLPGLLDNTLDVIDFVSNEFHDDVIFSLMSQYTPNGKCERFPELLKKVTKEEYDRALDYLYLSGLKNVYLQDLSSQDEKYVPPFDLSGVLR